MLVDAGNSAAASTVAGAIQRASQATGASFSYLLATAQVESGLNPHAGALTSSARGLFQFVEQTWLGMMKQAGTALGFGRYAEAITKTSSGHYEVKDPVMRGQILKLRNNPTANAVMAGAFTKANAAYLAQKLGRQPSEGELYIAHFLGAGGAAKLITLSANDPNTKAVAYFGHAAHANPSIFYDRKTGAARTLAQVRDALTARYDVARSHPDLPAGQALAENEPAPVVAPISSPPPIVPDPAGIAKAFAAALPAPGQNDSQLFHGLFADIADSRTGKRIASVTGPLWSVPDDGATAPGAAAPPPQAISNDLLDLFKDPVERSQA
jgi:Transglycosylase SLT domain